MYGQDIFNLGANGFSVFWPGCEVVQDMSNDLSGSILLTGRPKDRN